MDLADIATGLAGLVDDVTGLTAYSYQPDAIVAPCATVLFAGATYREAMGQTVASARFRVSLFVQANVPQQAQHRLMAYISPTGSLSVPAAISTSESLGSSGVSGGVVSVDGIDRIETGDGATYYVATIDVEVVS